MRQYKRGDVIHYRRAPDSAYGVQGRVVDVHYGATGEIAVYIVRPTHDVNTKIHVSPVAVIDQSPTSAETTMDRIHREDRTKAVLLDYLLGELNAYADRDGEIRYTAHVVGDVRTQKARHSLREIVDRYVAKRDDIYGQS